jgi:hypothetical protein
VKRRTKQISVTVDADVLVQVERRLRAEKKTLSAFVSDALAEEIRRHNLRAALDDFERRHGAITKEELSAARARVEKAARGTHRRGAA